MIKIKKQLKNIAIAILSMAILKPVIVATYIIFLATVNFYVFLIGMAFMGLYVGYSIAFYYNVYRIWRILKDE